MKYFLLLFILSACASFGASEWEEMPIAQKDQDFRWCSERLDGPEYAERGWCFQGLEIKKHFIKRDEQRTKVYFCSFTDTSCMIKNGFKNKTIVDKESIIEFK